MRITCLILSENSSPPLPAESLIAIGSQSLSSRATLHHSLFTHAARPSVNSSTRSNTLRSVSWSKSTNPVSHSPSLPSSSSSCSSTTIDFIFLFSYCSSFSTSSRPRRLILTKTTLYLGLGGFSYHIQIEDGMNASSIHRFRFLSSFFLRTYFTRRD
ncbi:hypothetical protein ACB094_01G020900 [Castanea mollissima]